MSVFSEKTPYVKTTYDSKRHTANSGRFALSIYTFAYCFPFKVGGFEEPCISEDIGNKTS